MVRVAAIGDTNVDCYISAGTMYPGGNCFNFAVNAGRFGAAAAFVGAVADDPAGRLIRRALETEGIDLTRFRVLDGSTAYCMIGHQDGDRVFLDHDLGVSHFQPDADDLGFVAKADAAHTASSSGMDAVLSAIAGRTRLSYDFADSADAHRIEALAPLCWLATVSAADRSQDETDETVLRIADAGADWVLATRGREGAVLCRGTSIYRIAARPVAAVDTLGAGDSFIARTAVGLLRDEDPDTILASAAEAAAQTCAQFGAVGYGAPTDLPGVPAPGAVS